MTETVSGNEVDRVFDRGYENGVVNERSRIIALLDQVPDMGSSDWADGYHEALEEAIRLVKGDEK